MVPWKSSFRMVTKRAYGTGPGVRSGPTTATERGAKMGASQVILGNADPVRVVRNGTPEDVFKAIGECHHQAGPRFIVGPGCEIPRDTPHENVRAFAEYARAHKPEEIDET